jgi:hypothetical protein
MSSFPPPQERADTGKEPNAQVVVGIDSDALVELLLEPLPKVP